VVVVHLVVVHLAVHVERVRSFPEHLGSMLQRIINFGNFDHFSQKI
jgi:hypothetical protein